MTTAVPGERAGLSRLGAAPAPALAAALAFVFLFWQPLVTLGRDWWTEPDAGQGLLLVPLAFYLAWRKGWWWQPAGVRGGREAPVAAPQALLGLAVLTAAVSLRYLSGLAAEPFTMRMSALLAAAGLVVFVAGWRQLRHWWLSAVLLALSVPLPAVLLNAIAFPLQLQASRWGATLLVWRHVPVRVAGNIIQLPGQALFVTEACSGLRSLTALAAIGVLMGGLWLRRPVTRMLLVAAAVPLAMVLNAVRVFLTGFLVYYVDPRWGEGVMHFTEGWAMFAIAWAGLALLALAMRGLEPSRRQRA